jgi:hypothetical protein
VETKKTGTTRATGSLAPPDGSPSSFSYTHLRETGNRTVDGRGGFEDAEAVDVAVGGVPVWVVARPAPDGSGAEWLVVTRTGGVEGIRVTTGSAERFDPEPGRLPVGTPPLLPRDGPPRPVRPLPGGSETTHPFPAGPGVGFDVTPTGAVRIHRDGAEPTPGALTALPDARFVAVDDGVAVLSEPTDRYGHGVLGDGVEATGVAVLDREGDVIRRHDAPAGRVIEGIAPLVGRFDDVGEVLVVTESGPEEGAAVVAYTADGTRLAGPAIGSGFRWRHGLALAPFGSDGEAELAVVRTPHIGGTVEFYRPVDGRLEPVAAREGYSSHAIGSRDLDGALAGDIDGDGAVELVVPDDDRRSLAVLRRTATGVAEPFRRPVGGRLTSNVHAVAVDGRIQVGVGREGALRLFV